MLAVLLTAMVSWNKARLKEAADIAMPSLAKCKNTLLITQFATILKNDIFLCLRKFSYLFFSHLVWSNFHYSLISCMTDQILQCEISLVMRWTFILFQWRLSTISSRLSVHVELRLSNPRLWHNFGKFSNLQTPPDYSRKSKMSIHYKKRSVHIDQATNFIISWIQNT